MNRGNGNVEQMKVAFSRLSSQYNKLVNEHNVLVKAYMEREEHLQKALAALACLALQSGAKVGEPARVGPESVLDADMFLKANGNVHLKWEKNKDGALCLYITLIEGKAEAKVEAPK